MKRQRGSLSRRELLAGVAGVPVCLGIGMALADQRSEPDSDYIVNVMDFGAVADGRTDDTPAFRAMHRSLIAVQRGSPQRRFVIHLPSGHYRYGWNQWLWGLRRVSLVGEEALLQCTSASPWDTEKFVLATNADPLLVARPGGAANAKVGYLIHTAEPGSDAVTLRDPVDARHFSTGRFALILSFDQQFGGYPPNCRYFDYARVKAIDGPVIVLDRSLKFRHSESWCEDPSAPDSLGKARIVPIDRAKQPFVLDHEISGITALPNPNVRVRMANALHAVGAYHVTIKDCRLINLVAGVGHRCDVVDTDLEFTEPDKLLTEMEFRDCRIGWISQATGIHSLRLKGCRIEFPSDIQARYVQAENCEFRGAMFTEEPHVGLSLEGFTPTRRLEVTKSAFLGRNGERDFAVGHNRSIAIRLTDPIVVHQGTIAIPISDERARTLLSSLEPGDMMLAGDEFAGTMFCDGRTGRVQDITADDTHVFIRTTLPVAAGDLLFTFRVRQAVFRDNSYVGVRDLPPLSLSTIWEQRVESSKRYRWMLTSSDFDWTLLNCPGWIERILVDVRRPYTGSEPGAFLALSTRTPQFESVTQIVDLTRPGRREASLTQATGALGGDRWAALAPGIFVWDFYVHHGRSPTGGHEHLAGSKGEQAQYVMQVETRLLRDGQEEG
jgi:Pectate lyase superfamily protein